jgi:hypothetical protein
MKRALQTAYYVFKSHPNFDKIKFIVCPLMREKLKATCDIPAVTADIINEFSRKFTHFDTGLIQPFHEESGHTEHSISGETPSMLKLIYKELNGKLDLFKLNDIYLQLVLLC